jgi:filamentous hemagglutinin family protein
MSNNIMKIIKSVIFTFTQLFSSITLGNLIYLIPVQAQLIPDNTLGSENSIVTPINGLPIDLIEGGTKRGNSNIFHSFQEFNVGTGRGVYFDNPTGIKNIFTRVTGKNPSYILGILGVLGDANLFFMNPKGIFWGSEAFLDLRGSFIATTASEILFEVGNKFSTIDKEAPPLLAVNIPTGLQFRETPQPITVEGFGLLGNAFGLGLKVESGKTLGLIGGEVNLVGGSLTAQGGRVEIGGLSEVGTLGIKFDQDIFSFNYPTNVKLANVFLNNAVIDLMSEKGGSFVINANNLNYSSSLTQVGIPTGQGSSNSRGADITINAIGKMSMTNNSYIISSIDAGAVGNNGDINIKVGSVEVTGNSFITSTTQGSGIENTSSGNISVKADGFISLDSSRIFNVISEASSGNSGDILLDADAISIGNASKVSSSTLGIGNAGDISFKAKKDISIVNSFVTTGVDSIDARGNAGSIKMEANSLFFNQNATVSASTSGNGNSGSISLIADDLISLTDNADVVSSVDFNAIGKGGDITIKASSLDVKNNSQIFSSTFNQGNSGNIVIETKNVLSLANRGSITSGNFIGLQPNSSVTVPSYENSFKGGNISIQTGSLVLDNNSDITANTVGFGDAGNISINSLTQALINNSTISTAASATSQGSPKAQGNSGSISIDVADGSLVLVNGGRLQTTTFSQGNAGEIIVKAKDSISLTNTESFITTFAAPALEGALVGRGGDIKISTSLFTISDSAKIISSTFGQKDSGDIQIKADVVNIDKGLLTTQTGTKTNVGSGGNAGNLGITTNVLQVQNGGLISSETFNSGRGGNITVNATDQVEVSGASLVNTGNSSSITSATSGSGNAGDLKIDTNRLVVRDRGSISASTLDSTGQGGKLTLKATELTIKDRGKVAVSSQGRGDAGNIVINTSSILLDNFGELTAETTFGDGGNIQLQASDLIFMRRGGKITSEAGIARGSGNGGNINIDTDFIVAIPFEDSDIIANSFGGQGGNININALGIYGLSVRDQLTNLSDITAFSQLSPSLNGEITLNLPEVDPSQGLVELPQTVVDPDALVAQNACDRRIGSNFIVTGKGGIPQNPSQTLSNESVEVNLVEPATSSNQQTPKNQTLKNNVSSNEIVPAQGWIIDKDGKAILTPYSVQGTQNHRAQHSVESCPM